MSAFTFTASDKPKFAGSPMFFQPNQIDRSAQHQPLRLNFFQTANGPAAKSHGLLDPTKHRFDRHAPPPQQRPHGRIALFFPLPHQRCMLRMDLDGASGLAVTALPAHWTGFIAGTAVNTHRIRLNFVFPDFVGIQSQDLPARTDALIPVRIVVETGGVIAAIVTVAGRFGKMDQYRILPLFGFC